jgi:hypothetical protein
VPRGASGSSTINARDFALGGIFSTMRGGFTSMPSHVYFEGMCSLCLKAGLVSLIVPIAVASISKEFKSNERVKTTPAREKLIVITHYRSKRFALIRKLN